MKKYFQLFTLISTFWIISACAENTSWNGSYIYEASLGDTVGGDAAVVTYKLTVSPNKCEVSIEGFQTSESIICKTKEADHTLDINFQSYSDGSIKNKYGINVYKVGSLLLQLKRTDNLITTWGELLPDEKLAKMGSYFIKEPVSKAGK
jgi:hypothetical protein